MQKHPAPPPLSPRTSPRRMSRHRLRPAACGPGALAALCLSGLLGMGTGQPVRAAEPAQVSWAQPSQWRLSAEHIHLPGRERVGLLGGSYLVGLDGGWWLGPSVHGAARGQRGGLFVIGAEALWRSPGPAGSRLEAGLFVGGGGGAAAPVGGGLMLRPHLDWLWPVGPAWVGVSGRDLSPWSPPSD